MNPIDFYRDASRFLELRQAHGKLAEGARFNALRLGEAGTDTARLAQNIARAVAAAATMRGQMAALAEALVTDMPGVEAPDLGAIDGPAPEAPEAMPEALHVPYTTLIAWEPLVATRTQAVADALAAAMPGAG